MLVVLLTYENAVNAMLADVSVQLKGHGLAIENEKPVQENNNECERQADSV